MIAYKQRLTWSMQQAGVSVILLAEALEVSPQAVRRVLDGSSSAFTAYNNAVAARFLGVNSDWLATGEGDAAPHPEGAALDVARRFDALSSGQQRLLLQRLEELEKRSP